MELTVGRYLRLAALLAVAVVASSPVRAGFGADSTVFVIIMENTNWSDVQGSPSAPYINRTLLPAASYATQYYNPPGLHPSEPNYLWIEAGTDFGIRDDNLPAVNHQATTDHLVAYLERAGISWRSYQEDISGTDCPVVPVNGYAPKHNPFVFFDDVLSNAAYCIAHNRPFSELSDDLRNGATARYNFITPNLCDDMHDSCAPYYDPVRQGDAWLAREVPAILASAAYQRNGVLFITWDEGGGGSDGPIGLIALSPLAKGGGYADAVHYTHSSLLKTLQEIFNVGPLLRDAANPRTNDLSGLFVPGAFGINFADAAGALSAAAGLLAPTSDQVKRWDTVPPAGAVDVADAVALLRRADGLDTGS